MPVLITNRNLLGAVAKYAVKQSPYHRPDNLEIVLDELHRTTRGDFLQYVKKFETTQEAEKWVREKLSGIPEFVAWNERKNGSQAPYSFVTRTSGPEPDDDFIDLDALYRNVIADILTEV